MALLPLLKWLPQLLQACLTLCRSLVKTYLKESIKMQIKESFQPFVAQFEQMKASINQATATAGAAFELSMTTQEDVRSFDQAEDWARNKIMILENKIKEQNLKFRGFPEDLDPTPDLCSFLLSWLPQSSTWRMASPQSLIRLIA